MDVMEKSKSVTGLDVYSAIFFSCQAMAEYEPVFRKAWVCDALSASVLNAVFGTNIDMIQPMIDAAARREHGRTE